MKKTSAYLVSTLTLASLLPIGYVAGLTQAGITEGIAIEHKMPATIQIAPVPAGPRAQIESWLGANLCPYLDAKYDLGAGSACEIPRTFIDDNGRSLGSIGIEWYTDDGNTEMKFQVQTRLRGHFVPGGMVP